MKWDRALLRVPAALYHVTRPDTGGDTSRDQLRTAACARGVTVVLEATDGAGPDRPGLLRVLDAAATRKVGVVFVPKLEELGDTTTGLLATVRVLRDTGCRLVVTSQDLDVPAKSDISDALVAVLGAVGELEREHNQRRAKRRADSAQRSGKKNGRPARRLLPDGACVHDLRQQGCSWGQIARRLNCTREAARWAFERAR